MCVEWTHLWTSHVLSTSGWLHIDCIKYDTYVMKNINIICSIIKWYSGWWYHVTSKKQAGWLPSGNVLPFAEHGPFSSLIYQPKIMVIFHPGHEDSCSVQRQRQLAMIEATVFVLTPLERIERIDVILFYFVFVGFYYLFPMFFLSFWWYYTVSVWFIPQGLSLSRSITAFLF